MCGALRPGRWGPHRRDAQAASSGLAGSGALVVPRPASPAPVWSAGLAGRGVGGGVGSSSPVCLPCHCAGDSAKSCHPRQATSAAGPRAPGPDTALRGGRAWGPPDEGPADAAGLPGVRGPAQRRGEAPAEGTATVRPSAVPPMSLGTQVAPRTKFGPSASGRSRPGPVLTTRGHGAGLGARSSVLPGQALWEGPTLSWLRAPAATPDSHRCPLRHGGRAGLRAEQL